MQPERHEETASDVLAAYLATIPSGLSAASWARWRGKNPPPYLRNENRQAGRCGICGGELYAWLRLCSACSRREFEYVQRLPQQVKPRPPAPKQEGRVLPEERVDHPAQGIYRPAMSRLWFVVRGADGLEVTRALRRHVAESYL